MLARRLPVSALSAFRFVVRPLRRISGCALRTAVLVASCAGGASAQDVILPGPTPTCITNTHTCVTLPVEIHRSDTTGVRAFSVTFQLSPELRLCTDSSSVLLGSYLTNAGLAALNVIDNGGGSYTADGTILGLPCGATDSTGTLFTIALTNTGGSGTGTVTLTSVDLRDCANTVLPVSSGPARSVTVDLTPVTVSVTPLIVVEELSALSMADPSATLTACATAPVTWSVAPALPSGATLNTSTGAVSWTPACGQAGSYGPFTLTATSANGEVGSAAFDLSVTHKVGTVSVNATVPDPVEELSALVMSEPSAMLTDCAATPVTWSMSPALPSGATLNTATGVVSWTPACGQAGSYGPFTLTASAATGEIGSAPVSFTVTHKTGVVAMAPLPDTTVAEAVPLTVTPGVSVTECAGALTWSAIGLPAGAVIAAGTGVITWTPPCDAFENGPAYGPIQVIAAAATGEADTAAFTITVTNTPGIVTVNPISDPLVAETTLLTISPSGSVNACASLPLTWSATGLPLGGSIDSVTGVITWTPDCLSFNTGPDYGPIVLTATAASGHSGTTSFTIHVTNSPGSVVVTVVPPAAVVELSALAMAAPGAVLSGCATGPVVWSVAPSLPSGAALDSVTGVVSWTPACGQAGSHGPFTLVATAASGEVGSDSLEITVTHLTGTVAVASIPDTTLAELETLTVTPSTFLTDCALPPLAWSGSGLPAGASVNPVNGVLTWTVPCNAFENGPAYGPVVLTATAPTGEVDSESLSIVVTNTPGTVAPVTALSASQVTAGNDSSGTTGITITFTPPSGASQIEVYRAGFGFYPEFDDNGGAAPPVPSYPPGAPWTLTGVTTSGQTDAPPSRDLWYYVAFARDSCGNVSVVSAQTGATLNYHLGDVSDGTPGQGDNLVNTADISALGLHYGMTLAVNDPFNYLDVGPTTTNSVNGRPLTDNVVQFEDLMIYAINYGQVAAPVRRPGAVLSSTLTLRVPEPPDVGSTFDVVLEMNGAGDVQGLSSTIAFDEAVVTPVAVTAGALLAQQVLPGMVLSAAAGQVDAAVLGTGPGITGAGELARMTMRVLAAGDPRITLGSIVGRDARNEHVTLTGQVDDDRDTPIPGVTGLADLAPNPVRTHATIRYGLHESGHVRVAVFDTKGRIVRSLVDERQDAGERSATWNARDDSGRLVSSGIYLVRLVANGKTQARPIHVVR